MSATHFATRLSEPIAVCGVRFDHASYDEWRLEREIVEPLLHETTRY